MQGGDSSPIPALQRAALVVVLAGSSIALQNLMVRGAFVGDFVRVTPVWVIFCVCAALRADKLVDDGTRRGDDPSPEISLPPGKGF